MYLGLWKAIVPPQLLQNSSSEVVPHVASDVIFKKGGGEAITMDGGVGRGVVNKGHVCGFI